MTGTPAFDENWPRPRDPPGYLDLVQAVVYISTRDLQQAESVREPRGTQGRSFVSWCKEPDFSSAFDHLMKAVWEEAVTLYWREARHTALLAPAQLIKMRGTVFHHGSSGLELRPDDWRARLAGFLRLKAQGADLAYYRPPDLVVAYGVRFDPAQLEKLSLMRKGVGRPGGKPDRVASAWLRLHGEEPPTTHKRAEQEMERHLGESFSRETWRKACQIIRQRRARS